MPIEFTQIDEHTLRAEVQVRPEQIVLIQATFESYEGLATVRTTHPELPILTIMTTPSQLDECRGLLEALLREYA